MLTQNDFPDKSILFCAVLRFSFSASGRFSVPPYKNN